MNSKAAKEEPNPGFLVLANLGDEDAEGLSVKVPKPGEDNKDEGKQPDPTPTPSISGLWPLRPASRTRPRRSTAKRGKRRTKPSGMLSHKQTNSS